VTAAALAGRSAPEGSRFGPRWRTHAALMAASWAALLLLFRRDVADLVTIYWTNTTFGHCLFVAPVVGWLVWQRRRELVQVEPCAWWPGLALVGAGGGAWLVGDAAGVALFRHAGLVLMLQGAAVTLLGPNVVRALLFPLVYMAFLIPFGDFLEAPLQAVTVRIIMPLLHLSGVPASADGVLITTPNGFFEVAEACSGAKFVIAMAAFGVLVANVCYVSWGRRIAFLAMALAVPVIANGIRAFGTIYAAWWTSVEQATGMDHIVYGWFFFAAVMAAVLAIGWKWFDRDPDAPWFDPQVLQAAVTFRADPAVAALLALALASVFPGWASLTAAQASAPPSVELPQLAGWRQLGGNSGWTPNFPGADRFLMARYVDAQGRMVDLAVAVYASQGEGRELVGFGIGAIRENDSWVRVVDLPFFSAGRAMRMSGPGRVERVTVSWYRVGDTLTGSESRVKFETLKTRLLGGNQAGVAVLLSAEQGSDAHAEAALRAFLAALGPVDAFADRFSGAR
jgi:exosortase A